jgi:outer membrane protein assembly factor BamB
VWLLRGQARACALARRGESGIDDAIGLITEDKGQIVRRVAISGSDGAFIWETEVGKTSEVPAGYLSFDAEHRLLLMTMGTEISAFELSTGERRWTSHLSDMIEAQILDGEQLFVATKDRRITALQLTDGTSLASDLEPSDAAFNLPKDWSTTQTPLTFRYTQEFEFAGLTVENDFCPIEALPWVVTPRMRPEQLRCNRSRGLALAFRSEGTKVPYWVGFSRADKAEIWRAQATTPGSLETLAGIRSYEAELADDFAVVWVQGSANPQRAVVRRLSLVDGEVAWSYTVESKWLKGVTIGDGRVFVTESDRVHVLDLDTGERLLVLGEALP